MASNFNSFLPAYSEGGSTYTVQNYTVKAAENFKAGAVLIFDTGTVAEAGTNPGAGTILGVSLADAGSNPGFNMANQPSVVTGRVDTVPVALAKNNTVFLAELVNNSAVRITPVAADVGAEYGITEQTDRSWTVDKAKTGANARVTIVKIDIENKKVWCKFLASFYTGA